MMSSALQDVNKLVGSHYQVIKKIGSGGFGTVSLVRSRSSGRLYACKLVRNPPRRADGEVAESRILDRLPQNKRIVRMHQVIDDRQSLTAALVLDYANGGDLYHLFDLYAARRRQLPEAFLWSAYRQLALALAFLHYGVDKAGAAPRRAWRGVVHGDVKPNNIVVHWSTALDRRRNYPLLILSDFGGAVGGPDPAIGRRVTSGTSAFLAPEQLCTFGADVWAMGCTIHELAPERARYSRSLHKLIKATLQPDPGRRPTSRELLKLLDDHGREYVARHFEPLASFAAPRDIS